MTDFSSIARQKGEEFPWKRAFPVDLGDRTVWVKQCVGEESNIFLRAILKKISYLPGLALIRPAKSASEADSFRRELKRLDDWRARGICVPEILWQADTRAVFSDIGVSLTKDIRPENIMKAFFALSELHTEDLIHGRPMIKDMTLTADGRIGFLDLEEDSAAVMPPADAKTRDWIVFLASAAYQLDDKSLERLCYAARNHIPSDVRLKLGKTLRLTTPFLWIKKETAEKLFGKEIAGVLRFYKHWRQGD